PANGKVASVTPYNDSILNIFKDKYGIIRVWTNDVDSKGTIISIVLDVTNVHYQRAPAAAKVIDSRYTRGKFRNAVVNENTFGIRFENEHNEILFETPQGKRCKVIQIAGLLARRIEDYVDQGQEVEKGEVIGLIRLGSQVTIILPSGVKPTVIPGQEVEDGAPIAVLEEL
ncbi:MAG: phosphatidylserine decarboxylase, partial [Chitinophagales bacterium]|nr:phosphatidylserine decarboxylase [Chitinophagales bacterium]